MKKLFVIIILASVIGGFFYFHNGKQEENKLIELGYSKEELKIINKNLNDEEKNALLKIPYNKNNVLFLDVKNVNIENLERYVSYYEKNKENAEKEEVILLMNAGIDEDIPYQKGMSQFLNDTYFIKENLERYLDYQEEYPKKDVEDIVKEVNVHLDYPFYGHKIESDLTKGNLIISNKYYNLGKDYVPENLVTLKECTKGSYQVTKETADAFISMCHDMKKENLSILAQSTYRSYATQYSLYNYYVNTNGLKWADTWSARAGYSEHQTGRAMDIVSPTTNFDTFENSKEYDWLQENAHKYGFILRYPEGKEYLTGYDYESWHYRYIGVEHATKVHELGITYDEYYEYFIK